MRLLLVLVSVLLLQVLRTIATSVEVCDPEGIKKSFSLSDAMFAGVLHSHKSMAGGITQYTFHNVTWCKEDRGFQNITVYIYTENHCGADFTGLEGVITNVFIEWSSDIPGYVARASTNSPKYGAIPYYRELGYCTHSDTQYLLPIPAYLRNIALSFIMVFFVFFVLAILFFFMWLNGRRTMLARSGTNAEKERFHNIDEQGIDYNNDDDFMHEINDENREVADTPVIMES